MLGTLGNIWIRHLPIPEFLQLVTSHTRRAVLATLTSVGLAGCTTSGDSEPPSEDELPDQCPTSHNLNVQWPRDLDPGPVRGFVSGYEAVGDFVMAYEEAYQVEQKAETQFHSPSISVELDQTPNKVANGFHVTVTYGASVSIEDYILLEAFEVNSDGIPKEGQRVDESEVPDDPEYIPIAEIEDQRLQEVLKSAANSGYGEDHTSPTGRYTQLIESHSANASLNNEYPQGIYFDVNGTPVLLIITERGGAAEDYGKSDPIQYYVSEYVVRRTDEENESPQDGTVVECRPPE